MKLKEIIKIVEEEYPVELAYDWDNPGLFFGNPESEINRVLVTLDITPQVIEQAKEQKAQLILSHHPLLISGIKTLGDNSMSSKMITEIVKNNIAVYSSHTNMDTAKNGINQKLAQMFSLKNISVLENDKPYEDCGLGRIGNLKNPVSLSDFCESVKEKLKTPFIRVCGNKDKIQRIAFASGSCDEYVPTAIKKGADAIVTAEVKYHHCIEYVNDGMVVIDAGHYPTEICVMEMFSEVLKTCDVEVIYAEYDDIFKVN